MSDNTRRIISLSGRKESGKTELAKVCEKHGYEKKSFATELKSLVCRMIGIGSIAELDKYKTVPIGATLDKNAIHRLSVETGIDEDYIKEHGSSLTENSTSRDWLQVIGTNVIRTFDPDWHVRKTLEGLDINKKYVFDDTRFPNELKALREIGAECWFIIRNKTDNISNHPSETALSYRDFDYRIIVNNLTLQELKKNWNRYIEDYDVLSYMREWLIGQLFLNNACNIPDNVLNKIFVYKEFTEFGKQAALPDTVVENNTHNGFVGDNGNPFVMETWKALYNSQPPLN
jgi:hypothetical protein